MAIEFFVDMEIGREVKGRKVGKEKGVARLEVRKKWTRRGGIALQVG